MKTKSKGVNATIIMLAIALAFRQAPMTLDMPYISTYCQDLSGYTPFLAGLAIGVFGLTQALFQIPFGLAGDRFGHKITMIFGLLIVSGGLVLAHFATSMWVFVLARAMQGSGAVISVGYAWAANEAGENGVAKAMSTLGMFISSASVLAFIVGPLLREMMPVNMMFLVSATLIFVNALFIVFFHQGKEDRQKSGQRRL